MRPLDYRFTDFAEFWQAASKFGVIQDMIAAIGEDRIRDAAYSGAAPSILPSGDVLFRHAYRVVIATPYQT